MTQIAKVDPILFAATYGFISKEESRPYLHGVFLQKHNEKGVIMVATDGHTMFVAYDKNGFVSENIIVEVSADVLKNCKKKSPALGHPRSLIINDNKEAVVYQNERPIAISWGCLIDGTFPDWRRVLPQTIGGFVGNSSFFNHLYIKRFSDAAKILDTNCMAIAYGEDESSPAIVYLPTQPNVFGVVMPVRCSGVPSCESMNEMFNLGRGLEQSNA